MFGPSQCTRAQDTFLDRSLGCSVEKQPLTYLGLPLGTTKPLVKDYAPPRAYLLHEEKIISKLSFSFLFRPTLY
jgi:hypothetical protein